MGAASRRARSASVTVPLDAVRWDQLPPICVATGEPTTGRWERRFGFTTGRLPVRESLIALRARRNRTAMGLLVAFGLSWFATIMASAMAAVDPSISPLGSIAAPLYGLGLITLVSGVILLVLALGTIPVRWRMLQGDNGTAYVQIRNAHPAFVDAVRAALKLDDRTSVNSARARRARWLARASLAWAVLLVFGLATLFATGHPLVAVVLLICYAVLSLVVPAVVFLELQRRRFLSDR